MLVRAVEAVAHAAVLEKPELLVDGEMGWTSSRRWCFVTCCEYIRRLMQFIDPALPKRHVRLVQPPPSAWTCPSFDTEIKGHPLLLYPTAQSDLLDCERFFLIKSIEPLIFAREK